MKDERRNGRPRRTRREFLRTAGRGAALAAIAAGAAALLTREGAICPRDGACVGCPSLRGCGLAPAEAERRRLEENDDG